MSYTFTEHTANGTQVTFPFRFSGSDKGYLRTSDIIVETKTDGDWESVTGWEVSGTHQITFRVPPSDGTKVRIRRVVDKEKNYAEFDRNVMLDMKSLNGSFIHLLEISQEILDGLFPANYYIKQDVSFGDNKITNLGDGTEPTDAVNKGQLDLVDKKHTDWNNEQEDKIERLEAGIASGISHRTVPWLYVAKGGEDTLYPPYRFEYALLFINGVMQYELAGEFKISNNRIKLANSLFKGDQVMLLVGSNISAPENSFMKLHFNINENQVEQDVGFNFTNIDVYLDGLYQHKDTYTLEGTTVRFSEPLPACTMSVSLFTK
ncbi:tail fiber protein [Proteus phage Premi]|uniref:Tail fiber protein n=1 Tax=Proteus phage Premi TaxID=3097470 RepID=A0ABZ1A1D9_9CAUD|nr:tail fiber protein [Proteus phage Premi]